jgi:hypothetical protein
MPSARLWPSLQWRMCAHSGGVRPSFVSSALGPFSVAARLLDLKSDGAEKPVQFRNLAAAKFGVPSHLRKSAGQRCSNFCANGKMQMRPSGALSLRSNRACELRLPCAGYFKQCAIVSSHQRATTVLCFA